jgi:hypothetical protein
MYIAIDHGHTMSSKVEIKVFKTLEAWYNFRAKNSSVNHRWHFFEWAPNYPTKSGLYISRVEKINGINQFTFAKA